MTPLGEKIKQLKEVKASHYVEAGELMKIAAAELATKLSELFENALAPDQIGNESELAKACSLKQPATVCVIREDGAALLVDLNRYKDGMLKSIDDVLRGMFLDITAVMLQEKYPEYQIRRSGSSIMVTEPPPPPVPIMEWLRSLVKPRKLI